MNTKQLAVKMEKAFNDHAAALETDDPQKIQVAWIAYAKAKNAYMDAYYGGDE
jgi:hypothetical protein